MRKGLKSSRAITCILAAGLRLLKAAHMRMHTHTRARARAGTYVCTHMHTCTQILTCTHMYRPCPESRLWSYQHWEARTDRQPQCSLTSNSYIASFSHYSLDVLIIMLQWTSLSLAIWAHLASLSELSFSCSARLAASKGWLWFMVLLGELFSGKETFFRIIMLMGLVC